MSENTLQGLMKTTMDNLKEMIDVNTIIGDPVETIDGTIIIPVSKVTAGFGSGGTEMSDSGCKSIEVNSNQYPFGGGTGAGISVSPVSFLVVTKDQVKMLPVSQMNTVERVLDSVPDVLNKIVDSFTKGNKEKKCCHTTIEEVDSPINPS